MKIRNNFVRKLILKERARVMMVSNDIDGRWVNGTFAIISHLSKSKIKIQFIPHLSPMYRGILSTIYVNLNKNINAKKNFYEF